MNGHLMKLINGNLNKYEMWENTNELKSLKPIEFNNSKAFIKSVIVLLFVVFCVSEINAQSGGPPMITDDPGTPEVGGWEINLSFNSDFKTRKKEFEIPLIDANYGFNKRTQLKIEFPYLVSKVNMEKSNQHFGNVKFGVKYRFLDEEKYSFSFSCYPQVEISTDTVGFQEFIFPIQFQKSFDRVVLGAELGYAYLQYDSDCLFSGVLVGYRFSPSLAIMAECNLFIDEKYLKETEATINFGIVYEINEFFKFISSIGTGIISPDSDSKTKFISFVGMQFNI